MTERCQTKFKEKFDNQNYIIYFGIVTASVTVLYFYRFHFVTLVFSYVLGCVACYYGLNSNYIRNYVDNLLCHFVEKQPEEKPYETIVKGCITCGSKDCGRHNGGVKTTEPWEGLQIHKQLDQAIEDFYNTILEQFVSSWYSKITLQPFFVDELRLQLRYASACLLRRALKVDYCRLITDRLLPCALRHYSLTYRSEREIAIHPAVGSRDAELKYLRCITNSIMPYLLNEEDVQNSVFRVLIREIFAGWVLLSLTDVLADPYILNTIIVLVTGDETMAQLPTTPNYQVEFLETFVRHTESVYSERARSFGAELAALAQDQKGLYAFMQYMKAAGSLHLLQFYKDIKSFQTKILNPDLSASEQEILHREACEIYDLYLSESSDCRVPLQPAIAEELYQLLQDKDSIKKLQTSRALYQAARQSQAILEKTMVPRFLHSEEFYKMMLGPRLPTGYHKQVKPVQKPVPLRTESIDGHVLDCLSTEDGEGGDKMDILKYLDALASDEATSEHDLKMYKVVLTNVEARLQFPPRRGTVRVFSIAVHRVLDVDARFWTVERSEHDFHLLRSKLHEFHGDKLLLDLPLPSRRDNSPNETLRYKYEDFLQQLLKKSLLQTSELLHLFLTVEGDFGMIVQAATLNTNSTDLTNLYQSVTYKLRKEKGQHLEHFLRNLLFSSDLERFQALKQGRDVEEAFEVSEDVELETFVRIHNVRDIHKSIFGNNFDTQAVGFDSRDRQYQTAVVGFTQCFMYLLVKVFRCRGVVSRLFGAVLLRCGAMADAFCCGWLRQQLPTLLPEQRLAHFIRLGHSLLFGKKANTPRSDPVRQRELARSQLLGCVPAAAALLVGSGLPTAVHNTFELIQKPHLNKQLVYNLLDLCLMELFPELGAVEPTREPKS